MAAYDGDEMLAALPENYRSRLSEDCHWTGLAEVGVVAVRHQLALLPLGFLHRAWPCGAGKVVATGVRRAWPRVLGNRRGRHHRVCAGACAQRVPEPRGKVPMSAAMTLLTWSMVPSCCSVEPGRLHSNRRSPCGSLRSGPHRKESPPVDETGGLLCHARLRGTLACSAG